MPSIKNVISTSIVPNDLLNLWKNFNTGNNKIDLVAIGSPHASSSECIKFLEFLLEKNQAVMVPTILTVGRATLAST